MLGMLIHAGRGWGNWSLESIRETEAFFALVAIPTLAFGQQGSPPPKVPKPTKADVQKVAEIISSDKAKLQAYCDSKKLYDQMGAAYKRNDSKTADALSKQADAVVSKLGPEYSKMMDGLEQVDQNSSEGKEFMSILSGLDKLCTGPAPPIRSTCTRSTCACPIRARSICADETLRPNHSGMHTGWFCFQGSQYGRRDHSGLHSTDHDGYSTTEAGHQTLATNRPAGRGRLQKSESKLRDARRSKSTTKRAADESVKARWKPLTGRPFSPSPLIAAAQAGRFRSQ